VTHDCNDLDTLLRCYPRGGYRLEPILQRFMPTDTVDWFRQRGVKLKTEKDGRMFPVTNRSETIADCLLGEAKRLGVEVLTRVRIDSLKVVKGQFRLKSKDGTYHADKVLLATGGASQATNWLEAFGHEVVPDIPSLFTFCCEHPVVKGLQGVSVAEVRLQLHTEPSFESTGPFLITHWGVSGPAVLKLSAFAARALAAVDYKSEFSCDFLPHFPDHVVLETLVQQNKDKQVSKSSPFEQISKRLWNRLVTQSSISDTQRWGKLSQKLQTRLVNTLKRLPMSVMGKGVFKDEFVTSGGLPLKEVDVYCMESKRVPGLFVAGELLDVDGITGGFNFQNAWATGFIAGEGLAG
jgi:predicted Rossmann fold flavoprotein